MWEYKVLDPTQLDLLERNVIDLGGEVDDDMIRYVREAVMRLTAKGSLPIQVLITSGGGSVDVGLDIYDLLCYYPGDKTGRVLGFAKSMAALILQACDHRQCMRHATLLIHHIAHRNISLDVLRDPGKLKEVTEDAEQRQARLYKILSTRTGKPVDDIKAECAKEEEMSAEEALAFGLIDDIVD